MDLVVCIHALTDRYSAEDLEDRTRGRSLELILSATSSLPFSCPRNPSSLSFRTFQFCPPDAGHPPGFYLHAPMYCGLETLKAVNWVNCHI